MEKELEWHEADTQRRVVAHLCPPSCVYCTRWCVCALCVYLHDVVSFTVLRYLAICYLPFSTPLLTTEPLPRFCPFLKCHSLTTGSMGGRQETKSLKLVLTSGHHWDLFLSLAVHYCKHGSAHYPKDHWALWTHATLSSSFAVCVSL